MTSYDTGDIVLVRFPFTDLDSLTKRPAIVISPAQFVQRYGDCVLMPLTSQPQPNTAALAGWQPAGLLKPTWVEPILGTLSSTLLIRTIGKLQPEDDTAVSAALAEAIDSRW